MIKFTSVTFNAAFKAIIDINKAACSQLVTDFLYEIAI